MTSWAAHACIRNTGVSRRWHARQGAGMMISAACKLLRIKPKQRHEKHKRVVFICARGQGTCKKNAYMLANLSQHGPRCPHALSNLDCAYFTKSTPMVGPRQAAKVLPTLRENGTPVVNFEQPFSERASPSESTICMGGQKSQQYAYEVCEEFTQFWPWLVPALFSAKAWKKDYNQYANAVNTCGEVVV